MRYVILLGVAFWAANTRAQTVTSVQDGNWIDPATWNCNCVPELQDVLILHTVQLTTNMQLSMQQLHVAAGAAITTDEPHAIYMMETVTNDGVLLMAGLLDVDGELFNNNVVHMNGQFLSHGQLVMGGWGTLLTTVDMEMGGTIGGQGHICISGTSVNYGSIQDEVDICDLTPTTAIPPFIDINIGTVAPTVTYCAGAVCAVGVFEGTELENVKAWPVPANEQLTLEGLPPRLAFAVEVRDPLGRMLPVRTMRDGSQMQLDVSTLPAGIYTLVLSAPLYTRCMKVVVE